MTTINSINTLSTFVLLINIFRWPNSKFQNTDLEITKREQKELLLNQELGGRKGRGGGWRAGERPWISAFDIFSQTRGPVCNREAWSHRPAWSHLELRPSLCRILSNCQHLARFRLYRQFFWWLSMYFAECFWDLQHFLAESEISEFGKFNCFGRFWKKSLMKSHQGSNRWFCHVVDVFLNYWVCSGAKVRLPEVLFMVSSTDSKGAQVRIGCVIVQTWANLVDF